MHAICVTTVNPGCQASVLIRLIVEQWVLKNVKVPICEGIEATSICYLGANHVRL